MLAKIIRGALIAGLGAALTYLTNELPNVAIPPDWLPIVTAGWAVLVNIVRKLIGNAITSAALSGWLLAAVLVAPADAQQAAPFSWGPSVPTIAVRLQDEGPADVSMFGEGAGVAFKWNRFPNEDGSIRWLTIGVPVWARYQPDPAAFGLTTAVTFGVLNDLFAIGPLVDLADTGNDTGLLLGDFKRHNFGFAVVFGLNFGPGVPPAGARAAPSGLFSSAPPAVEPPPGYVKVW